MDSNKINKESNFEVSGDNENFINKIKTHPIGPLKIGMNNDIELKNSKIVMGGIEIKPNFEKLNKMEKLQQANDDYKNDVLVLMDPIDFEDF